MHGGDPLRAGTFLLTEDGRPAATIRIPAQASDIEQAAAADLQAYIEKGASGARGRPGGADRGQSAFSH